MIKDNSLSMSKAILAVLWRKGRADTRVMLNHHYINTVCSRYSSNTYRSSLHRLLKSGLIERGNGIFTLTDAGRIKALTAFIDIETELHRPDSKWDGGWRIVFFDIPESERKLRDNLRRVIRRIGFREFQKSIWVYPYPVPPFLKDVFRGSDMKKYARFIITDEIDNDSDLRTMFKLPKRAKIA